MKVNYEITLQDHQSAQRLHWSLTRLKRVINFSVYTLMPTLLATCATLTLRNLGVFFAYAPLKYFLPAQFVLCLLLAIFLERSGRSKRFKKRFLKNNPSGHRGASIEVDESGVASAEIGTEAERFPWETIIEFAHDDRIALFYLAKNKFIPLPVRAMTAIQHAELNDLVIRHVNRSKQ